MSPESKNFRAAALRGLLAVAAGFGVLAACAIAAALSDRSELAVLGWAVALIVFFTVALLLARTLLRAEGEQRRRIAAEQPSSAVAVVVDFLSAWSYCPMSRPQSAKRSALEDAARQLLAALPELKLRRILVTIGTSNPPPEPEEDDHPLAVRGYQLLAHSDLAVNLNLEDRRGKVEKYRYGHTDEIAVDVAVVKVSPR